MGNSFTCPCSDNPKEGVVIMKSDGAVLKFKKGVQTKEVVASNPDCRVVRFDSDRTVLSGTAELESNRLYFLVPEDKARCRETFEKFREVVETTTTRSTSSSRPVNTESGAGDGKEFRRLSWIPQLRTIPEILSPEAVRSPLKTPCSFREQLAVSSPLSPPVMVR